jgi:polysaccharide chain length determinant protein (PEP-CTERM system associated)
VIPGKRYTPELVLSIVWRRKWMIVIPTILVAVIACTITYFLPDKYRSEAAILVVPPRVSENYVRSTVTTKVEDRLRSINQQVRSRTKLERIIEDLGLYTERRKKDIMQDIVDDMSKDIDIDIVQGDVFRLAFTSDDPRTAMQVTERLTTFFIDESLKDRTQLAEQAGDFLEQQVADAGRRLRETEQKIAEYKKKHDGELPTQEFVNQQGLNSAQIQVQNTVLALERGRDQQQLLQRRMQDLAAQAEAAAALPISAQEAPQSKAAQLDAARADLQGLQAKYRQGHPRLDRAAARVAQLEREAAEESAGSTALGPQVVFNPLAARRLKDLDDARIELESLNRQMARYDAELRGLRGRMAEYQRRMELAPLRDTELVELSRDYATLKTSYESLSAKRIESQVSVNLERRQIGEQFKILDPARLPEKPDSPNRGRLYVLSVILAIVVGFGLAAGGEYLDHGLRSEDDVRLALALPVLATIPVIGSTKKKKLTLWRKAAYGSAAATILAAVVGAVWVSLR